MAPDQAVPVHRSAIRRLTIVAIAAVAVSLPVMAITVAGVFRTGRPALAVSAVPFDADAVAIMAQKAMVASPGRQSAEHALAEARRGFRRDGVSVDVFATAGLATALMGDRQRAARLFRHAEDLSRRNAQTQLWLIEDRVAANDIPGALRHYDTILRTSTDLRPVLFPVLVSAATDPAIATRLNQVLRARPAWWMDFIQFAYGTSRDPAALASISTGLLRPADQTERRLAARLLKRLIDLNRFDLAWAAYRDIASGRDDARLIRDGGFERESELPPVEWEFAEEGSLSPERRPREDGGEGFALYLPANASIDGEVARQLLRLQTGGYEFGSDVGGLPADDTRMPFVQIVCATNRGRSLLRAGFSEGGGARGRMRLRFEVPQDCPYQWLQIRVRGWLNAGSDEAPWIAAVNLRRI